MTDARTTAPAARAHDQHHPFDDLEAALVLSLIDWKLKSEERDRHPIRRDGKTVHRDQSDLMDEALTRVKGLVLGVLDPLAVQDEIERHGGAKP